MMMNRLSDRLSNFVTAVKNFRIKQVLIIAFASFFLLVNTACSAQRSDVSSVRGADNRQSAQRQNDPAEQKTGLREFTDRQDGKSRPDLGSYVDKTLEQMQRRRN
jgi:hypothetical protein